MPKRMRSVTIDGEPECATGGYRVPRSVSRFARGAYRAAWRRAGCPLLSAVSSEAGRGGGSVVVVVCADLRHALACVDACWGGSGRCYLVVVCQGVRSRVG
jgi:hypothetical protein